MDKATTQAALSKADLADLSPQIDVLVQPAIHLQTTPISDAQIAANLESGISKMGGMPDLPPKFKWPVWKKIPQSFVAQLRLSDLQPCDTNHWLPQEGMLWFFYDAKQATFGEDPKDVGAWLVYYSADIQHLQRATPPKKLPIKSQFQVSTITFTQELTMSQQPQLELTGLTWDNDQQKKYDDVYAQFTDVEDKTLPRHQMFGHPNTLQDDMRQQCQLNANGVTDIDDPRAAELAKGANDWHLLLQVDSDERTGMNWGSTGILYYWIKLADLQAQKFDKTWLVLQSE